MHKKKFFLLLGVFSISLQGCSTTRVYRLDPSKQSAIQNIKWSETTGTRKKWVIKEMCSQDFGETAWIALPLCVIIGVVIEPFRGWEKVSKAQVVGDINVNLLSPGGLPLPGLKVNNTTLGADSKYNLAFSFSPGRVTETRLGTLSMESGWEDKFNNGEVVLIPKPQSIHYDAKLEGKYVLVKAIAEPNNILLPDPYHVVITTKTTFSPEARKRIADKIIEDEQKAVEQKRIQKEVEVEVKQAEAEKTRRMNALILKYGKMVTRKSTLTLQDRVGNESARVTLELAVAFPELDITGRVTLENLQRNQPQNLFAYGPIITYNKNGRPVITFFPPPPDFSETNDVRKFLVNPGEQKTRTVSFSQRLINDDYSWMSLDLKLELVKGLLEGSRTVGVSVNPNGCNGCSIYFDFIP